MKKLVIAAAIVAFQAFAGFADAQSGDDEMT